MCMSNPVELKGEKKYKYGYKVLVKLLAGDYHTPWQNELVIVGSVIESERKDAFPIPEYGVYFCPKRKEAVDIAKQMEATALEVCFSIARIEVWGWQYFGDNTDKLGNSEFLYSSEFCMILSIEDLEMDGKRVKV